MKRMRYDWWWKATVEVLSKLMGIDHDGAADLLDQYADEIKDRRELTPSEAARLVRKLEVRGVK